VQFLSSSPTIAERWIEQGKTNKNTKFLHLRSGKKVEKKWLFHSLTISLLTDLMFWHLDIWISFGIWILKFGFC